MPGRAGHALSPRLDPRRAHSPVPPPSGLSLLIQNLSFRQGGHQSRDPWVPCFSGALLLLPQGTSVSHPLPSTTMPDARISKPRSVELWFGEESPTPPLQGTPNSVF